MNACQAPLLLLLQRVGLGGESEMDKGVGGIYFTIPLRQCSVIFLYRESIVNLLLLMVLQWFERLR